MQSFARDVLLSFCPASFRREHPPESLPRATTAAKWTGLFQFFAFGYLMAVHYVHFVTARMNLWGRHIAHTSEVFQSGVLMMVTLEFFLYPISFLLFYFFLEGFARFATGLISSEVVPTFPVFLFFRLKSFINRRRAAERVSKLPPDSVTSLPYNRLRVATALARPTWLNPSLTISVGGTFYELERVDKGALPHPFVYYLHIAPVGKILRGVEEYTPPIIPQKD